MRQVLQAAGLLLAAGAHAQELGDPALLAPGLDTLAAHTAELATRVERAEALTRSLARVQNALAEPLAQGAKLCADPALQSLAWRSAQLGPATRQAAQAARTQGKRVDEILAAPTVTTLVGLGAASEGVALTARAGAAAARYVELAAWHKNHVSASLRGCPATPAPAPGLVAPTASDWRGGVAVIVLAPDLFCPGALPAGVHVGSDGCVSASPDCACAPEHLLAGAVMSAAAAEDPAD